MAYNVTVSRELMQSDAWRDLRHESVRLYLWLLMEAEKMQEQARQEAGQRVIRLSPGMVAEVLGESKFRSFRIVQDLADKGLIDHAFGDLGGERDGGVSGYIFSRSWMEYESGQNHIGGFADD